jgi:hypothetical protein
VNTRYTAQAVSFEIYEGENGKAPQVGVKLLVVEGADAGKEIFWYGSLHENAQQYTAEALRAMGWSCNDITTLEGLGTLKVIAVEKQEEYKGKLKTKYMIFPVKTPKPTLEADSKASFANRFKALAASVAPAKVTDENRGLSTDELPAPIARTNGTSTAPVVDGPTGGQPF